MALIDYNNLTKMQIDALKEVGNIGAAHAATALSQILDKTVMVSVSRFEILPLPEVYKTIGKAEDEIVAVHLKLLGNVPGGIILIFALPDAGKLSNIMGQTPSELIPSCIKEAGSILSAAYLAAIGRFVKLSLIPAIPKLEAGRLEPVLAAIFSEITKRAEVAFCIETAFVESAINLKGYFLLVPEVESLEVILRNLGV